MNKLKKPFKATSKAEYLKLSRIATDNALREFLKNKKGVKK